MCAKNTFKILKKKKLKHNEALKKLNKYSEKEY